MGERRTTGWTPPFGLLVHLANQALCADSEAFRKVGYVIWIGRRVWPYPPALASWHPLLLTRSLFIDPPDDAGRLWATDLALRCAAFAAVIADGRGLKMPHTRRLQLAAGSGAGNGDGGGGGLGLIVRPPWERRELSAAATRWEVCSVPAAAPEETTMKNALPIRGQPGSAQVAMAEPRWRLKLLRRKGRQGGAGRDGGAGCLPCSWLLEQDCEQGVVRLSSHVADRPSAAAAIARLRTA